MKVNPLRKQLSEGGVAINGWIHIPSTWSAEVMAHAGWDSLTIDLQHGVHSVETAVAIMQSMQATDTVPLVRVNWNEPGSIMRMLDGGAYGIICPMVNTREECEAFVGACYFPPQGYRSFGPTRANLVFGADYGERANQEIMTIAMVETPEALENVEAIASVPGLDMIFVGVRDLRVRLTGETSPGEDDSEIEAALDRILAACNHNHIAAGLLTSTTERAGQMIERGFRFITVKTDTMILSQYAQQLVQETRKYL